MVIALIPARSGSKGVPHKNIRMLCGKPLIAWSIAAALASSRIDRVIVSTDSEDYARIARDYGAEVPFIRPPELATDTATDLKVFHHALGWLREAGTEPEIFVHLRPTHPIRDVADIDAMIDVLETQPTVDAVRSVRPASFTPFKMWFKDEGGTLGPVVQTDIPDAYNQPRQNLPVAYEQTAAIDVLRARTLTEHNSMTGKHIHGYVIDQLYDIDSEQEFLAAEHFLRWSQQSVETKQPLRLVVDIDGVIASITPGNDYTLARPMTHNIELINALHAAGHQIVLFTARGYVTGINWREQTESHLNAWGVRYDELHFGKPNADFYIDDKLISLEHLRAFAQP